MTTASRCPNGGFDAVLGNPPWDMLRAGGAEKTFFRSSGVYRHQGAGHINRYQMFVERALTLTKRGGRIGLVLPAGFATDHTSAPLRRTLLSRTSIDTISGFDNRRAIFPIHRSVRFLICTSTVGEATQHIACRFGIDDPAELETIPDSGDRSINRSHPIALTPAFLEAVSGHALAIPELRSETDLRILERIVHSIPRLDAADGWGVRFGRELNATDDRLPFSQRPAARTARARRQAHRAVPRARRPLDTRVSSNAARSACSTPPQRSRARAWPIAMSRAPPIASR